MDTIVSKQLKIKACKVRMGAIEGVYNAKSGHPGGSLSCADLVAALYFGQQVYDIIFAHDNVANFMHIVGGVCGTAFGYVYAMLPRKHRRPAARKKR